MATKKKHPGGRPTKYKNEFCKQMEEFFSTEPYEDKEIPHYKNGDVAWTDFKRVPNKLPTMVGFARELDVSLAAVYDWLDKNNGAYQPEFLQTYIRIAKRLQKDFIIQNGMQGITNPIMTKFIAVNLTDMSDTQVKEVQGKIEHEHGLSAELTDLLNETYEDEK